MASQTIRTYGDPVLRTKASEVTDIDGKFVDLCDKMFDTMYEAPGIGLAAPQVGVQKRFFVYDTEDEAGVLINPQIVESKGEWTFEEGCLSIPGMTLEIVRPKIITVTGIDFDGNEVVFEADELFARLIQHELDHLDGVLMVERLEDKQRKEAVIELEKRRREAREKKPVVQMPAGLALP